MNILIPMAGLATRFVKEGIHTPKPLISVLNKTLIEHSIETLGIQGKYIFITRKYPTIEDNTILSSILKEKFPNSTEICLDFPTRGAVETCLFASDLINNEEELIITNCDQRMDWDSQGFINFIKENNPDGIVVTHDSNNPKHSYAIVENNKVIKIEEKNPISKYALVGIHYWKNGEDFINSAKELIVEIENFQKKECYVSETYNYLIKKNKTILNYHLQENQYIPLGTPYDIKIYEGKIREYYTEKPKTIFCDIDGTILEHFHTFSSVNSMSPVLLEGVTDKINEWDSYGHKIIFCTSRKESARELTEKQLKSLGLCWDLLLMGMTSGERVLINDKLQLTNSDRAKSVNLITNKGFKQIQWKEYDL